MRHRQPHAPDPGLALAELDDAARPAAPRARRAAGPCRSSCARPPAHAVVADLHHPGALLAPQRDLDAASACACLCALRTASASTDCASGSSSRGTATPSLPGASSMPRSGCASLQALDLLGERRLASRGALRPSGRCSARRRSRSAGLQLDGDPLARLARQLRVAREREQDAEQPLDHALVHLAGEVDALLQLARARLLERREARGLGERGRSCRASTAGGAPRRTAARRGRRSARITPIQRPPADSGRRRAWRRRAGRGSARAARARGLGVDSMTRSSTSAWRAIGADSTVTCASREAVEREPVGAGGAHARGAPRRSGRSPRGPSTTAGRRPRTATSRTRRRSRRPPRGASSSTNVSRTSTRTAGACSSSIVVRSPDSTRTSCCTRPAAASGDASGPEREPPARRRPARERSPSPVESAATGAIIGSRHVDVERVGAKTCA